VAPRGPSSLRFHFGRVAAMARSIAASARILSFNEFPALLSGLVRCSRSAPIGGHSHAANCAAWVRSVRAIAQSTLAKRPVSSPSSRGNWTNLRSFTRPIVSFVTPNAAAPSRTEYDMRPLLLPLYLMAMSR
jgi:hypothetical protein